MRVVIAVILLLAAVAYSEEATGATDELLQARTALEAGEFNKALEHAARVQVFSYRDADAMAAALYVEALADHKTGGSYAKVSALMELKALYPDSTWCRKAVEEIKQTEPDSQ